MSRLNAQLHPVDWRRIAQRRSPAVSCSVGLSFNTVSRFCVDCVVVQLSSCPVGSSQWPSHKEWVRQLVTTTARDVIWAMSLILRLLLAFEELKSVSTKALETVQAAWPAPTLQPPPCRTRSGKAAGVVNFCIRISLVHCSVNFLLASFYEYHQCNVSFLLASFYKLQLWVTWSMSVEIYTQGIK